MKIFYRSLVAALAASVLFSCSNNNVHTRNDWGNYFSENNITGCFMLHDAMANSFDIYNVQGTQNRHSPANTFDIMSALTGIETGIISDTNMTVKDTAGNSYPNFNPDLTMAQAFRQSNESYFSIIAKHIGKVKMDFWLDSVKYGNMETTPYQNDFWMNNTLQISPDEQMGLLENLYTSKLPFQSRTIRLVKSLLLQKKTMNYSMFYKTGFLQNDASSAGWIIGWFEKNDNPYFFVLYMHSFDKTKDLQTVGFKILNGILTKEGYLKK